jgi:hypothetical protein
MADKKRVRDLTAAEKQQEVVRLERKEEELSREITQVRNKMEEELRQLGKQLQELKERRLEVVDAIIKGISKATRESLQLTGS